MINYEKCTLCPRKCQTNRVTSIGFCGGGNQVKVARAALHQWEEPCISGTNGSGTIFFSGCSLKCCFCQNYKISGENYGKAITVERLAEIFLELQNQNAHNINLVNPTHYVPWIIQALNLVKDKIHIPIIYNSSGYETIETLKMLDGYIDVYLPDFKYLDSNRSLRYSKAEDYFRVASTAIEFMYKQVGEVVFDENQMIQRGVIIRHLVLPKGYHDSILIMDWISKNLPSDKILISLMSQYTPCYKSNDYPEINRRIFTFEYHKLLDFVHENGLNGYMQDSSSAGEEYTPDFNFQGV